jgi:hypothetical protein
MLASGVGHREDQVLHAQSISLTRDLGADDGIRTRDPHLDRHAELQQEALRAAPADPTITPPALIARSTEMAMRRSMVVPFVGCVS